MSWEHFKKHYLEIEKLSFALDISRMNFADDFLAGIEPRMEQAFSEMEALENGAIANPDEDRMVGHYWLRDADLAPTSAIRETILAARQQILEFTENVHSGKILGEHGDFRNVLVIGIGGSTLGPQFVAQALGGPRVNMLQPYFFDNTDPDGFDRTLDALDGQLGKTLAVIISKSGGTPETRNGMLEAEHAWKKEGLDFARHAVAVTGEDSKLDHYAKEHNWLAHFPMWDWVGGRTSELAAVGLLPAALQGINIGSLLEGAREMDKFTRAGPMAANPAALLAAMWYHATGGKGDKDMVILPYKDSLMLFSKYLQQLIMESLGKEHDLAGNVVNQGIAVYGNKGSTDQHAYVQQLRDGVNNFFVTFIEVLFEREGESIEVEKDITSGDFLQAFYLGTREALHEKGRESITITINKVDPFTVGALIALYERAVGFYATLVNVNAYHQPGVEAGKKAAAGTLDIRRQILAYLREHTGEPCTAKGIADELGLESHTEFIFKLLENMSATPFKAVEKQFGSNLDEHRYIYTN